MKKIILAAVLCGSFALQAKPLFKAIGLGFVGGSVYSTLKAIAECQMRNRSVDAGHQFRSLLTNLATFGSVRQAWTATRYATGRTYRLYPKTVKWSAAAVGFAIGARYFLTKKDKNGTTVTP